MSTVRDLMAAGTQAILAQSLVGSVTRDATATGTTQADALPFSTGVIYVTTAASGTGVRLNGTTDFPATIGDEQTVYNYGANTLSVYPPVGEAITPNATNVAVSVAAGASCLFKKVANLTWVAAGGSAANMTFIQSGTGAVATTVQARERLWCFLEDYGGSPSASAATNDTAFTNAFAQFKKVILGTEGTYSFATPLVLNGKTLLGLGQNATKLSYTGTSGVAITAYGTDQTTPTTAPHLEGFSLLGTSSADGGILLGFAGTGCRRGTFRDIHVTGFTKAGKYGIDLAAALNNGIYYNYFENVSSYSNTNNWRLTSTDGATQGYRCNSNTFVNCSAQSATTDGVVIDYANRNVFIGFDRETNGRYGYNIDHTLDFISSGGDSETNTTAGANLTANSTGVKILEIMADSTAYSGTRSGLGNVLYTSNFTVDDAGNASFGSGVKCGAGVGIGGATPGNDRVNFNADGSGISVGGTAITAYSKTGSYNGQTGYSTSIKPFLVANSNASIWAGTGSPNGAVNGYIGSLYLQLDGGAGTCLWVKESGANTNTGWVSK